MQQFLCTLQKRLLVVFLSGFCGYSQWDLISFDDLEKKGIKIVFFFVFLNSF